MKTSTPYSVLKLNRSESSPGTVYEIRFSRPENHIYCTCPSWKMGTFTSKVTGKKYLNRALTPKARLCKHLEQFSLMTVIPGSVPVQAARPVAPQPPVSAPQAQPQKPAMVSPSTAWKHILENSY